MAEQREHNVVAEPGSAHGPIVCPFCEEPYEWPTDKCDCQGAVAWGICVENYEAAHPGPVRHTVGYYS